MHGDAARLLTGGSLHFARMHTGADLELELAQRIAYGEPAPNRARRPVEEREEAVARCVDLLAVETVELGANRRVVLGEEVPPRRVAELVARCCRADEVREEDASLGRARPTASA